jgi:O-antigen ligase
VLTAIAVAAALAAGAAFLLLHRDRFDRGGWKPPFRLGAALAVGSVLAILVGAVAISYFSEQSEELPTTASRLADVTTFRGPYWRIALQAFANHPVDGIGSGSFRVEWLRKTKVPRGAVDAHSLYFETLGELGLVGGVLLLIFLVSVGVGSVRAARAGPRDAVLPACFAVMAAWTVHVGVDWDWELPGVTLPALVLAAAALAASPRPAADLDSEA